MKFYRERMEIAQGLSLPSKICSIFVFMIIIQLKAPCPRVMSHNTGRFSSFFFLHWESASSIWRSPCKLAPNDYFVAIFQVAPNWLKFGMSTLSVLKNVRVFFHKRGSKASNTFLKVHPPRPSRTPPPPPPAISLQWRKRHMHSVLALKDRNSMLFGDGQSKGGGGGGEFDTILSRWHFVAHKE